MMMIRLMLLSRQKKREKTFVLSTVCMLSFLAGKKTESVGSLCNSELGGNITSN
jgi:hypothetical protein